jgi:hypothetical protein
MSPSRRRSSSSAYDVRARARRPLVPQLPFLPCDILESAALAPHLERWRLDASAAAAAPRRARWANAALD